MFNYKHPSEEGEMFRVLKRQPVAIFDYIVTMFNPDIYIGKIQSLVFVHYDIIQTRNIKTCRLYPAESVVQHAKDYGWRVERKQLFWKLN
jgi:hypothetical protein